MKRPTPTQFNRSILCVDDEKGVLESYRDVLSPNAQKDLFTEILDDQQHHVDGDYFFNDSPMNYNIFLAESGEEAVRIVQEQIAIGKPIAAGFFDMRMPGGMDGYQTVKMIRELDPRFFCAIVTAYYDRNIDQIRKLFVDDHQDELLYFKKPFSVMELQQTAFNIVSVWNRKRTEEKQIAELTASNRQLKREIQERERLQAELLHAQKMEVLGRLAGGVAHDFNNALTPIIGYTELSVSKLPDDNPIKKQLFLIHESGVRAAGIVRQLLAFSRKQILEMKSASLVLIVKNMIKMLGRLIGEDVTIELHTEESCSKVMVDTVQIEQVLMNLAVNARDAMPNGGRFSISVSDVEVTDGSITPFGRIKPGSYVLLKVSDSGSGIEPEMLDKIFEPFFTTKDVGKGTGLGLSTVYGVVKQHNGFLNVDSTIDHGTTFEIYLPVTLENSKKTPKEDISMPKGGTETVLLTEDDLPSLQVMSEILRDLGYNVLDACNATEALRISASYADKIDVLLTDVIMPDLSGPELAKRLGADRPETKNIFMSGYTDELLGKHNILQPDIVFLAKPIMPSVLAATLRSVLDKN